MYDECFGYTRTLLGLDHRTRKIRTGTRKVDTTTLSVRCAVVGGDDKTQCCASNSVTGGCLDVCSGNITNFPDNILVCHPYFNIYASCFYQKTTVAPTTAGDCSVYEQRVIVIFYLGLWHEAEFCDFLTFEKIGEWWVYVWVSVSNLVNN